MKIEEYAPVTMPTISASEMSRSVPAPSSRAPMNRIAATGSTATMVVLIDRTRVWFTARLTASPYVRRVLDMMCAVFSRTLSNTTTVSYSEKPRMVRKPITVAGVTSNPDSEYTPAVRTRSCASATRPATASCQARKYSVITIATRTRKITRPVTALRVMSAPQEAPTNDEVISEDVTP